MKINDIKLNYDDQYFPTQFQLGVEMKIFLTPEEVMVDDLVKACGTEKIICSV